EATGREANNSPDFIDKKINHEGIGHRAEEVNRERIGHRVRRINRAWIGRHTGGSIEVGPRVSRASPSLGLRIAALISSMAAARATPTAPPTEEDANAMIHVMLAVLFAMTTAAIYLARQMREIGALIRQSQEIERMPRLIHADDNRTRGSTPTTATGTVTRTRTLMKVGSGGPEPMGIESDSAIFGEEPVQITGQRTAKAEIKAAPRDLDFAGISAKLLKAGLEDIPAAIEVSERVARRCNPEGKQVIKGEANKMASGIGYYVDPESIDGLLSVRGAFCSVEKAKAALAASGG
ncbi:unnamed protein product, partial [Prorocentrum cordatum]